MEDCLDQAYGSIPGGGYFSCNNEYELAAQRIAEEAHCILGSLHGTRMNYNRYGIKGEKPHIMEEIGLINKNMEEYSRDVYTKMMFEPEYPDHKEWAQSAIGSILIAAPTLEKHARHCRKHLKRDLLYGMAHACYTVLIELAVAMKKSVEDFLERGTIKSAFKNTNLEKAVFDLNRIINVTFN